MEKWRENGLRRKRASLAGSSTSLLVMGTLVKGVSRFKWSPASIPRSRATAAARSESSMNTIALTDEMEPRSTQARTRLVVCASQPQSSALIISTSYRISRLELPTGSWSGLKISGRQYAWHRPRCDLCHGPSLSGAILIVVATLGPKPADLRRSILAWAAGQMFAIGEERL